MTTTMPIRPEHSRPEDNRPDDNRPDENRPDDNRPDDNHDADHAAHRDVIERLAHEARTLWRREPVLDGRTRTEVMRDLASIRLDLEAVERRQSRAALDVEDERTLHYCASRLEALRMHWAED